jgi:hypothetical protein
VEIAALDVARKFNIPVGGWITPWRAREFSDLVKEYRLRVLTSDNPVLAARHNIRESQAVLIFSFGNPVGNAELYLRMARRFGMESLHIDLELTAEFEAAHQIESWLNANEIESLLITGSGSEPDEDLYEETVNILDTVFQLELTNPRRYESPARKPEEQLKHFIETPETVTEAVDMLLTILTFHDRSRIANITEYRLPELMPSLGAYIRHEFRLEGSNLPLLRDCLKHHQRSGDDPTVIILRALWNRLRASDNVLKVIK